MTYSIDLRKKVISFVRGGGSKVEAAKIFGIRHCSQTSTMARCKRLFLALPLLTYKVYAPLRFSETAIFAVALASL